MINPIGNRRYVFRHYGSPTTKSKASFSTILIGILFISVPLLIAGLALLCR